jgi:hypothetical protein
VGTIKTIATIVFGAITFSPTSADVIPLISLDPAEDSAPVKFVEPPNNKTWGYSFYVTSPIRVTYLGWDDTNRDGLSHSHQVGIWKDTTGMTSWPYIDGGQLVASATIPAGTAAELSGPWRRVAITPITLGVGGYSIGGQNNSNSLDNMVYMFPVGVADSRVTLGSFDDNVTGKDGFFPPGTDNGGWYALIGGVELGPMLFLERVPEPSAVFLCAAASAASLAACWHRKRANS